MEASFTKAETTTDITYTGINEMAGVIYYVKKDDNNLNITVAIPVNLGKQTWQQFTVQLDKLT